MQLAREVREVWCTMLYAPTMIDKPAALAAAAAWVRRPHRGFSIVSHPAHAAAAPAMLPGDLQIEMHRWIGNRCCVAYRIVRGEEVYLSNRPRKVLLREVLRLRAELRGVALRLVEVRHAE
jgi:hypothetical protein